MRQIKHYAGGKELETFLVFRSPEEKEDFFTRSKQEMKERQFESLDNLRRAYMEGVKKIDEAFLKSLGELRSLEGTSLLESDLKTDPEAPAP